MTYRVGIVGFGYWGPIVCQSFQIHHRFRVVSACDRHESNLRQARARWPLIRTTTHVEEVLDQPQVDLVVIATQATTHFPLAHTAITCGKHVLVEKPASLDAVQVRELDALARRHGKRFFVDHTFLFTPAYEAVANLVATGELGALRYMHSVRGQSGPLPSDVNVFWHLLYHDVYLATSLCHARPTTISATMQRNARTGLGDIGSLILTFPHDFRAYIHGNLAYPWKCRDIILGGERQTIHWNEAAPCNHKLRLFPLPLVPPPHTQPTNANDPTAHYLPVSNGEALFREVDHLALCLDTGQPATNDGATAVLMSEILQAADESVRRAGQEVSLS